MLTGMKIYVRAGDLERAPCFSGITAGTKEVQKGERVR